MTALLVCTTALLPPRLTYPPSAIAVRIPHARGQMAVGEPDPARDVVGSRPSGGDGTARRWPLSGPGRPQAGHPHSARRSWGVLQKLALRATVPRPFSQQNCRRTPPSVSPERRASVRWRGRAQADHRGTPSRKASLCLGSAIGHIPVGGDVHARHSYSSGGSAGSGGGTNPPQARTSSTQRA